MCRKLKIFPTSETVLIFENLSGVMDASRDFLKTHGKEAIHCVANNRNYKNNNFALWLMNPLFLVLIH